MPATKPTYNPAKDNLIATLFLHRDEDGYFLDTDTHLYHSEEHAPPYPDLRLPAADAGAGDLSHG